MFYLRKVKGTLFFTKDGKIFEHVGEPEGFIRPPRLPGMPPMFDPGLTRFDTFECVFEKPRLLLAAGIRSYVDYVPSAFYAAWRGDPRKLELPKDMSDWDERLRKAANALAWPKDQREICWWLVSNEGRAAIDHDQEPMDDDGWLDDEECVDNDFE